MILEQAIIHNFRQYYGTFKIVFSRDKQKNITVIHGENGTGKTALLNAFSWCLYGKITLPNPDDLINHTAEYKLSPEMLLKHMWNSDSWIMMDVNLQSFDSLKLLKNRKVH